ncbi:diaminopimelate decarboxylase [Marinitoga hydrogenitolerans DSM 16785]|uniref:Diaminopimelate decarboxylase n=1 Tax=Marinitoga hydrogenitolerans (strain DSM 16785 / JCM 12826 / AT1271) TaxID=1122195 RepID=A0A1M4WGT6_MARH1|nr:diaminopimelate decarboxylase [Marinitoga hydrogenitolerans]SHE80283.1 diaminopimelate decarboxylase [Marinitoga hydrogenitolerans DSM 16785]
MKELLENINEKFGTPAYVYFEEEIEKRINKMWNIFKDINLTPTFAVKANNNPNILKLLNKYDFGADIVTIGEYKAAELAGIPKEKIVWNGNGKSKEEIQFLNKKIKYVNIDSFEEMRFWQENNNEEIEFFLRVNPDINAKTHPHISTGLKKNKFGIPIHMVEKVLKNFPDKRIKGLHFHIGSQITEIEPFVKTFEIAKQFSEKYNFRKINIGGGWGINYVGKELDLDKYKKKVIPLLKRYDEVILELGRFIIAPAGILLLKVVQIKETENKTFIVTNGGMNDLIRPALYNSYHEPVFLNPTENKKLADIVGPLCESGDKLVWDKILPIPELNSLIYLKNSGAYGYSMSNNYNSALKPAEILVTKNHETKLIRKRESYDDLYKNIIIDG